MGDIRRLRPDRGRVVLGPSGVRAVRVIHSVDICADTPVTWLERRIGRVAAVLKVVVVFVFTPIGLAGWGLARQLSHLAQDLPSYRTNITTKIADTRGAGKGSSV